MWTFMEGDFSSRFMSLFFVTEEEKCHSKKGWSSCSFGGKTFTVCGKKRNPKSCNCPGLMGAGLFGLTQTLCTVLNSPNINVSFHIHSETSDTSGSGPGSAAPLPLQQRYPATVCMELSTNPKTEQDTANWITL